MNACCIRLRKEVGLIVGLSLHRNDQKCRLENMPFELYRRRSSVFDSRWLDGQQTPCERIVVLYSAKLLKEMPIEWSGQLQRGGREWARRGDDSQIGVQKRKTEI